MRWLIWRAQPSASRPGKTDKLPLDWRTGRVGDAQQPYLWLESREMAQAWAQAWDASGVGIVLLAGEPRWGLDLDDCLLPDGSWAPHAVELVQRLAGCYVDVSPSGRGLRIIGGGHMLEHACRDRSGLHMECYSGGRFLTVTGVGAQGSMDHVPAPDVLARIVSDYFPPSAPNELGDWTLEPVPQWSGPDDDEGLVALLLAQPRSAGAAFGARASFAQLWQADGEALGKVWPDAQRPYDASRADAALAAHLAWATGSNCERMERLMRRSGLARDKWEHRPDYLRSTIAREAGRCTRWMQRRAEQLAESVRIGEGEISLAPDVLTFEEMLSRLVYIRTGHVADLATGRWGTVERVKEDLAASMLVKAWLQSPARKTADGLTWDPSSGAVCRIPEADAGNSRGVNLWRGHMPMDTPDDWERRVEPFVEHVEYLVPLEVQRVRLMQWLSHIAQYPGELPHTAYLMTAGQTGIGRNWLAGVLARVFAGNVAAGVDLGDLLDGGYNGRLGGKLLAIVDEVRDGMGEGRYRRAEKLKTLISEITRALNPKYGHQRVEVNCCRWMMFSNYDDALPLDAMDRRVIVIANPTVRRPPAVFMHIYGLLRDPKFIASVRHLLATTDLAGFDPGALATMSAAKEAVIASGLSGVDRAVADFARLWPEGHTVAPLRALRDFVTQDTGERPSDRSLHYAMKRAGLVRLEVRVRVSGVHETVVHIPSRGAPPVRPDHACEMALKLWAAPK